MSSIAIFPQQNYPEKNQAQPQLPIAWYADPNVYALEQQYLFANAPKYAGHALMVPNAGDYYVQDWMHGAKSLVNRDGEISLVSNVCRHRQAIMLNGSGNSQNIVCPLHRWTYSLDGKLLGAPHFDENPCLHLQKTPLQNWQGMLFETPHNIVKELDSLGCKHDFDFSDYKLDSVNIEHYQFNWKTFIEVYLEDYHVGPFHPGLNQVVDCADLHWDFGENFSAQTVGYKDAPAQHLSSAYQTWQAEIQRLQSEKSPHLPPKHGAIWMVYYPFLMMEWYPNVLVVSHLIPTGVNSCSNVVEFYYPEEIACFERAYVEAQQAAYHETAIEDKEICQRMHDGRQALFAQNIDQRGPYQHPLETGLAHFHMWYRKHMQAHLNCSATD
jgi:choline monooxygenase